MKGINKIMISRLKLAIASSFSFCLLAASFGVVGVVSAQGGATRPDDPQIQESLCQGSNLQFGVPSDCETETGGAEAGINNLIADIVNVFSIIVGIVAVIMIIYGGFRYITSGGDSGNVSTAKNTILYAIIGLIIVALAQFIVKFVLSQATGLTDEG